VLGVANSKDIADAHQESGHTWFARLLGFNMDVVLLCDFKGADRQCGKSAILDDL